MDGMEVILKSVPSLFLTAYMQYTLSKMQSFVCHSMSVTPTLDPSKVSLVTIGLFGFSYCLVGAVVKTQPKHENILKEVDEETLDESVTEEAITEEEVDEEAITEEEVDEEAITDESIYEEAVSDETVEEVVEEVVADLIDKVVIYNKSQEPVTEEPVAAEPVAAEPVAAEPVAEVQVADAEVALREPVLALERSEPVLIVAAPPQVAAPVPVTVVDDIGCAPICGSRKITRA